MNPFRTSLNFAALVLFSAAMGSQAAAQCPEEPVLQNWTGAGTVTCPCFVVGEEAAVVLDAPASHYPIEILRVQIGWGSAFGGAPQSLEQAIHIYPSGLPNPGTAQFSLAGPVLTDGFINEFDISSIPGDKIITSGPFTVSLEFANENANDVFAPSVVHDGNGCQPGKNAVNAIPGGWNDACTLGVTGDWVMGVVYRRVSCDCTALAGGTFRNAGPNPASYTASPPVLGATFTGTVNLNTTGHTLALLLGYETPLSFTLGAGQVLLVNVADPNGEIFGFAATLGPAAMFSAPVPSDVSFCGFTLATQAVHLGGVQPFALSNAQDLTVGM